jgi:surface protein
MDTGVNDNYSAWDVFYGVSSFNQTLDNFNISKVTTMEDMYYGASKFYYDIYWDVSRGSNTTSSQVAKATGFLIFLQVHPYMYTIACMDQTL